MSCFQLNKKILRMKIIGFPKKQEVVSFFRLRQPKYTFQALKLFNFNPKLQQSSCFSLNKSTQKIIKTKNYLIAQKAVSYFCLNKEAKHVSKQPKSPILT